MIITVLLNGDPVALFTNLNTASTILVLMFGSAVLNLTTNIQLADGSVLRGNS